MEYNIVELLVSMAFAFLVGFVVATMRPKDILREALYRANPELRPAMTFTVNDKLEILWYRYEFQGQSFLATLVNTQQVADLLGEWYDVMPDIGDYVVQQDNYHFVVAPLSFLRDYKRQITKV